MTNKMTSSQKDVFLNYLSEIERNKIWPLSWEISYKKQEVDSLENYIATQLFNENTKKLNLKDVEEAIWFVKRWKHNLIELKTEIESNQFLAKNQKNFLINNIDSILTRMELVLKWVYIEAEKWWYKLDREKRNELKQKVQKLCNQIRWPRASDVPDEKFLVLKNIYDKFCEKKDVLSEDEKGKLNEFFEKFQVSSYSDIVDNNYEYDWENYLEKEEKLKWTIHLDKYVYIIKMILENIYGIDCVFISKWKDFRNGRNILETSFDKEWDIVLLRWDTDDFDEKKFIENKWLSENFFIKIDPNKENLSAWAWIINIPYSQNYKSMDITRFLSLIEHELKHIIRARSTADTLPLNIDKKINNIPLSNKEKWFEELDSAEIEEWITKFSEEAVSQDIENMKANVSIWHIATFIWENYWYDEWKQLLKIYLKLNWKDESSAEKEATTRIRRIKRFFPLDEPGAYWKDTLYYRSKKNIIELVQQCQKENNPKKLEKLAKTAYVAKLWKHDIQNFHDMIKSMATEEAYDEIPYEIWKIIYTKLSGESLKDAEKWDIRFSINKLNAQQKRALVEILKYTKKNIN